MNPRDAKCFSPPISSTFPQLRQEFWGQKKAIEKILNQVKSFNSSPPDPKRIIEAILFCANEPIGLNKISGLLAITEKEAIDLIDALNQEYERDKHAFRIYKVAGGYQFYTLPQYANWIRGLFKEKRPRLSKAAREVLAIIAFSQPITKPEIEKLRNVDSDSPISLLLERRLIRIAGRAKKMGAPFLYCTTQEFLRYFGLASLDDLPKKEDIETFLSQGEDSGE